MDFEIELKENEVLNFWVSPDRKSVGLGVMKKTMRDDTLVYSATETDFPKEKLPEVIAWLQDFNRQLNG